MKRSNLFLATFLTVFSAAGCATMSVKTDYDRNRQIPSVRTFAWIEQPEKPVGNPIVQNSLMDKRIKRAVERGLEALGYEKDLEKPALLVVYHTGLEDKIDVSPWGYGYGGYYGRGYGGHGYGYGGYYGRHSIRGGDAPYLRTYKEGTLILDFVDPETMQLVWRGWAIGALDDRTKALPAEVRTPGNAAMYVNKAVRKILKKFPPQDDQA